MTQTVLITGASTGIGRATAIEFHNHGWNVVATMRHPERADGLPNSERCYCVALDVTDPDSILAAITAALQRFGQIDVLINNAGYGLTGAFENATPSQIRAQFDTNVFGLMDVTRAILPHFRQRQQGVLVNVASMGGRLTFPLYSLYHSTKWAVEGFSESLQYELRPFKIKVKIIEPGPIKTDFYSRSAQESEAAVDPIYDRYTRHIKAQTDQSGAGGADPAAVAKVIYRASTDGSWRLRYATDAMGAGLLFLRQILGDGGFIGFLRLILKV